MNLPQKNCHLYKYHSEYILKHWGDDRNDNSNCGFSNCGLSYEEAKYCLCHVASDWML